LLMAVWRLDVTEVIDLALTLRLSCGWLDE
jgi:hypothetical protein